MPPLDEPLLEAVFDRLTRDQVPEGTADLILGACAGDEGLDAALAGATPTCPRLPQIRKGSAGLYTWSR